MTCDISNCTNEPDASAFYYDPKRERYTFVCAEHDRKEVERREKAKLEERE